MCHEEPDEEPQIGQQMETFGRNGRVDVELRITNVRLGRIKE